jgi:hypothetical protein
MRKRLLLSILAIVMAFPAADAFAWNSPGHMTVAMIAYRRLSDRQKQQVAEVLQKHPHYEKYLTENLPAGADKDEWVFVMASTWPDWVRPAPIGEPPKNPAISKKYHRSYWHYITINYVPPPDKKHPDRAGFVPKPTPDRATTAPTTEPTERFNLVEAMADSMTKLSSPGTDPEQKAVALAWLEHLIGDVHEPMHTISEFTPQYPAGDKGGNDQAIRYNGKVLPLHTFWDDILTSIDYKTEAPVPYPIIDFLATRIAADPLNGSDRLRELKANTTFDAWARESHDCAVAFVYLNGTLETAPIADYRSKKITADDVPGLPVGYETTARQLSERRIALAGYRLAEKLSLIFKP